MLRAIIFSLIVALSGCRDATPSGEGNFKTDLGGEWAVEWEDPKKKETEIFYIWFIQTDGALNGSALDPNLMPAKVSGDIKNLKVVFHVDPQDGAADWAAIPTSKFEGRMESADKMEGRWSFSLFNRGNWRAWRTFRATPSVTVTAETIVGIKLTSEEYNRLTHAKDEHELKLKESRRVGDDYHLEKQIGHLAGWLYYYRLLGDFARIDPASADSILERRLQEKILRSLNEAGYPWTKIPR